MEEDIKILEKMIDLAKRTGMDMTLANKIENLLTRYKQLEEENRTLKRVNKMTEDISIEDITQVMDKAYKDFMKEFISKSKVEEQINWLDNDIKNTKHKLEEGKKPYPNYIGEHRRLRMKAFNTKSKEIKERLQRLLEEE